MKEIKIDWDTNPIGEGVRNAGLLSMHQPIKTIAPFRQTTKDTRKIFEDISKVKDQVHKKEI